MHRDVQDLTDKALSTRAARLQYTPIRPRTRDSHTLVYVVQIWPVTAKL